MFGYSYSICVVKSDWMYDICYREAGETVKCEKSWKYEHKNFFFPGEYFRCIYVLSYKLFWLIFSVREVFFSFIHDSIKLMRPRISDSDHEMSVGWRENLYY